MGMFRFVEIDLACERCGGTHRAEVQFKTGQDRCEDYTVAERVDDLPAGEEWKGIADRFCRPCYDDFRAARERATAATVAEMLRTGEIMLREADAEAPLLATEILARGEEKAEIARELAALYGLPLVMTGLWFLNYDGTWLPTSRMHDSRWSSLYGALCEEMRRTGWPSGDDPFRQDLVVYVDQERRIQVRLQ